MDLLCVTQEGPQSTRSFQWRSQRATKISVLQKREPAVNCPTPKLANRPWCDASLPDTQGEDTDAPSCTTVVLENLPRAFTQFQLLAELTYIVPGTVDMVYVPVDLSGVSSGHGVVNFTTHQHASFFKLLYDGKPLGDSKLVVKAAEKQGFESNHAHYTDALRSRGGSSPIFLREPLPTTRRSVRRKGRGPSMIDLAKKRQDVEQTDRCKHQQSPEFLAATATDILHCFYPQWTWQGPVVLALPCSLQSQECSLPVARSIQQSKKQHQQTDQYLHMVGVFCQRCGENVASSFKFCHSCGSPLQQL